MSTLFFCLSPFDEYTAPDGGTASANTLSELRPVRLKSLNLTFTSSSFVVVNDSRSVENEILQLMLYREAFIPREHMSRRRLRHLLRKIDSLGQMPAGSENYSIGH